MSLQASHLRSSLAYISIMMAFLVVNAKAFISTGITTTTRRLYVTTTMSKRFDLGLFEQRSNRSDGANNNNNNNNSNAERDLKDKVNIPLALPPYAGIPRITDDGNTLAFKSLLTDEQYDGNVAKTQFAPRKFQLQYTCNVCNYRNMNMVSRRAYREGVVISICKKCNTKHMIADNLGWDGFNDQNETQNIEDFFHKTGQSDKVNRVSIDAWDLEKLYRSSPDSSTSASSTED